MASKNLKTNLLVGLGLIFVGHFLNFTLVESLEPDDDTTESVDQDSLCPRNREDASARGRQCLRKCRTDGDCISPRKRCLCDGLCGWSCVRPDLNCDELPPVANGDFKITGDYFGARVIYTCEDGFYMSGSKERVCQGDGTWSDQAPECRKEAMCGSPQMVPHAKHNAPLEQTDFTIDSMVHYSCFPGYESTGFTKAKCLFYNGTAKWFGPELKCVPRSCGHPGDISNGQREGNIFTFTSRVTYNCNDGYEIVGKANRYCQSNGQWSGALPSCRPVECPRPENPSNGKVVFTTLTFNSVVRYECRYGYKLYGNQTQFCGPAKQWQGDPPKCFEIDCESPGVLHNGYLEGRRTTLGSIIHFRCFDGMIFSGNSNNTTCLDNGTWSHSLPSCLAPCIVPNVENGRVNGVAPGIRVMHGQEIKTICFPRYELNFNQTPAACNNGTWTYIPNCVPARCKQMPEKPKNGLVIAPKTDHGTKALFQCLDGYSLVGSNVTECHFGKWLQSSPVCQEIYCPFPGFLENGRVLLVGHMGMYDYRPYVRRVSNNRQIIYECAKGYFVKGAPAATCVAGQWSPKSLPVCSKGSHPNVQWTERRRRSVPTRNGLFLRVVSSSKTMTTTTTNSSSWPTAMTRMKFKRAAVVRPVWAQRKPPRKVIWNMMRGRRHQRPKASCKALRTNPWMDVSLVSIGSGNDSFPHGTVVNVKCSHGYVLNIGQNQTARCTRGFWKPKEPECVISPCSVPSVANGFFHLHQVKQFTGASVNHGEAVHLKCSPGFQPRGTHSIRCWYGNWSAHGGFECIPSPCLLPPVKNGYYTDGYRSGSAIANGAYIEYKCDEGYSHGTQALPRCLEGRLSPEPPHCIDIHLLPIVEGSGNELVRADASTSVDPDSEEDIVTDEGEEEEAKKVREMLEEDDIERKTLENSLDSKFNEWCSSPEKLEHILRDSISGEISSDSTTLSLIGIAEISEDTLNQTGGSNPAGGDFDRAYNLTQLTTISGTGPSTSTTTSKINEINETQAISENIDGSGGRGGLVRGTQKTHPPNTELVFRCITMSTADSKNKSSLVSTGRKTTWKITCEHGDWFGRPLACNEGIEEELVNRTCIYSPESTKGENVLAFWEDELLEEDREFPPNTMLVFRCDDIGKYSLTGSTKRVCTYGDWDGVRPDCFGLSQEHDYALEKAPTILFRHQLGPIAQSNDGRLIVYPGIILHLECLWIRKYGNPVWEVGHDSKEYQQGWTTEPGRDSNLEYRLSIYDVKEGDSGRYTCVTPVKHRHSVDILVKAVHCPPIEPVEGLLMSNPSTKMNTKVMFACREGMKLNGSKESVCLPSGKWSKSRPHCIITECPDIQSPGNLIQILTKFNTSLISRLDSPESSLLKIIVHGRRVGNRVTFACPPGYGLDGAHELVCLETGQWSHSLPKCIKIICQPPIEPEHGFLQEGEMKNREYIGGAVVKFACNSGYMMEGNPIIICQENQRWSGPPPLCVPACTYPGTTSGGSISKVKFYYNVNESVAFECGKEYELVGPRLLKCLETGRWSNAIPICVLNKKGYV